MCSVQEATRYGEPISLDSYDPAYFLDFTEEQDTRIAYAASFGKKGNLMKNPDAFINKLFKNMM